MRGSRRGCAAGVAGPTHGGARARGGLCGGRPWARAHGAGATGPRARRRLRAASKKGDAAAVRAALDAGFDANARDTVGPPASSP